MQRIKLLFVLMSLCLAFAGLPDICTGQQVPGHIVGRTTVKFDNYQGVNKTVESGLSVNLKIGDKDAKAVTDGSGYFVLDAQDVKQNVTITTVKFDTWTVPHPMGDWDKADSHGSLRNLGHITFIVTPQGKINIETRRGILFEQMTFNGKGYSIHQEQSADSPVLRHFSGGSNAVLRDKALAALDHEREKGKIAALNKKLKDAPNDAAKEEIYKEILALDASNSNAMNQLRLIYNGRKQHEKALQMLLDGEKSSDDAWLRHLIAEQYELLERYDDAQKYHRKHIEMKPESEWAYSYLAESYFKSGHPEKADAVWAQGRAAKVDKLGYVEGLYHERHDDPERAARTLADFLRAHPGDWGGTTTLLNVYRDLGRVQEGVRLAEQFEQQSTSDNRFARIGDFYKAVGQWDKALNSYRKYHELNPQYLDGVRSLAGMLRFLGQGAEGDALWRHALADASVTNTGKHLEAGKYFYEGGDFKKAAEMFEHQRAVKDSRWNQVMLARSYVQGRQQAKAEEILTTEPTAYKYYYVHFAAADAKQYDKAIDLLKEAQQRLGDKSLSVSEDTIKSKIARLEGDKKLDVFWLAYLQQLEDSKDQGNWEAPPAKNFEKNYPAFATDTNVQKTIMVNPGVRSFSHAVRSVPRPSASRPVVTRQTFKKPDVKYAQEVVKKYKSIPGGITLEGNGSGLGFITGAVYDKTSGDLLLNGKYRYELPVADAQAKALLQALAKDDRLGVSLGDSQIVYGALSVEDPAAVAMKLADHFLGCIVFNQDDWLKGYKLAGGYKPLTNYGKLGAGGIAVYFTFGDFAFKTSGNAVVPDGSSLSITLIPLSKEKNAEGGHLPDQKAIESNRNSYFYKQNIQHILDNSNHYMREPLLHSVACLGQFAALARALKANGVDLAALASQM